MDTQISKFLYERIDAGDFPSAVYLVAEKGKIVMHEALGYAVVEPERIEAKIDTIYDLASLTKPLVTGLLCAKLIERGEIKFKDRIGKFFDEFDTEVNRHLTFESLLTHISGLGAWKPFYLISNFRSEIPDLIAREESEANPGEIVIYSDLNFLLLTFVLEKIYGESFKLIAEKEIFESLGFHQTFFNPPNEFQKRIAASEKGNEYEKQTCIEQGYHHSELPSLEKDGWPRFAGGVVRSLHSDGLTSDEERTTPSAEAASTPPLKGGELFEPAEAGTPNEHSAFRTEQIWGEVHDGNAYFMGGVAGHAGLFSNAEEVFKIAQQFLPNYTTRLKPETCELFRTNFTKGLNEARSLAFQLAETPDSTAGSKMSPDSFGHLGFTGTSLWIDPAKERVFILLTNRMHNRKLPFSNINSVRRRFHDLTIDFLDKKNAEA